METNTEERCVLASLHEYLTEERCVLASLHEYRILETEYQMPDGDVSWHRCADWLELTGTGEGRSQESSV